MKHRHFWSNVVSFLTLDKPHFQKDIHFRSNNFLYSKILHAIISNCFSYLIRANMWNVLPWYFFHDFLLLRLKRVKNSCTWKSISLNYNAALFRVFTTFSTFLFEKNNQTHCYTTNLWIQTFHLKRKIGNFCNFRGS